MRAVNQHHFRFKSKILGDEKVILFAIFLNSEVLESGHDAKPVSPLYTEFCRRKQLIGVLLEDTAVTALSINSVRLPVS